MPATRIAPSMRALVDCLASTAAASSRYIARWVRPVLLASSVWVQPRTALAALSFAARATRFASAERREDWRFVGFFIALAETKIPGGCPPGIGDFMPRSGDQGRKSLWTRSVKAQLFSSLTAHVPVSQRVGSPKPALAGTTPPVKLALLRFWYIASTPR